MVEKINTSIKPSEEVDKINEIIDNLGRNVGEIVESTIPLTDAGLHLLDGSLIQGDGIYSDFYDYMVSIWQTYPQIFTNEIGWQVLVNTYGVCGKFVLDEDNRTVRLPKITGFIEGTNTLANLGALTAAGLPIPNISMPTTGSGDNNSQWHKAALMNEGGSLSRGGLDNDNWVIQTLNANNSTIYGNSSTVQPQSIKVLFYICIATSTKTDIQVDIDEIATDLNGKVDIDLSNVNASGTSLASGWSMPSSRYINLTLGASYSYYTAPANGWFVSEGKSTGSPSRFNLINTTTSMTTMSWNTVTGNYISCFLPVRKGDVITQNNYNYENTYFRFIYAEGEQ